MYQNDSLIFNERSKMLQLNLTDAKQQLPELLQAAFEGQEVVITNNKGNAFQLILLPSTHKIPQFGGAKGMVKILNSFDDPLEGFEDYATQLFW